MKREKKNKEISTHDQHKQEAEIELLLTSPVNACSTMLSNTRGLYPVKRPWCAISRLSCVSATDCA